MATPFSRTVFFKLMQQRENDLANRQTNESALMDQTLKSAQAIEEIKNKQFDRERQQAELMAQQAHARGEEAPQFQNPVYSQASTLAFRGAQDDAAKAEAERANKFKTMVTQTSLPVLLAGKNQKEKLAHQDIWEQIRAKAGVQRAGVAAGGRVDTTKLQALKTNLETQVKMAENIRKERDDSLKKYAQSPGAQALITIYDKQLADMEKSIGEKQKELNDISSGATGMPVVGGGRASVSSPVQSSGDFKPFGDLTGDGMEGVDPEVAAEVERILGRGKSGQ